MFLRAFPFAGSASLLGRSAICFLLTSPATYAAAVDPNTGQVEYPDTTGADTSSADDTDSGTTDLTPEVTPKRKVFYTDVCEDYLSTDWELVLQAGVDASMVNQVSSVDIFEFELIGYKVTASFWFDAIDVSFTCTEMVEEYLETCLDNAEDDYARCIGWGDGSKPGAGTDWVGCMSERADTIEDCENTYVDMVGIDFGQSTASLDGDLSLSISSSYTGRLRTYKGSIVLTGRLYEKRINPNGSNTVQFCLTGTRLGDIDFPILESVVGDAISEALSGEICFSL